MRIFNRAGKNREKLKNRWIIMGLIALSFILFLTVGILRQPVTKFTGKYITNTIVIFAILYLNILLLVAFLIMLYRNITKLIHERSKKIPGSKFSTKLVLIFTSLILIPTLMLFLIASDIISSNVDLWFSQPVEVINQNSAKLVSEIIDEKLQQANHFAGHLSDLIYDENLLESRDELEINVKDFMDRFEVDIVNFVFKNNDNHLKVIKDVAYKNLELVFPEAQLENAINGTSFMYHNIYNNRIVVSSGYPIYHAVEEKTNPIGVVITSFVLPEKISSLIQQSQSFYSDYQETKKQKINIKNTNIMLLSMITLILLFSATWLGLRLAREITQPIQKLVEGTEQIRAGNLNFRVDVEAGDELETLVDSFNSMSEQLQISKKRFEDSTAQLKDSHKAIEEQFHYIETILKNIPAGIVSIGSDNAISTINDSAADILEIDKDSMYGINYKTVFRGKTYQEFKKVVQNAGKKKSKTQSKVIETTLGGELKKIAVVCSPLKDANKNFLGIVVVLEDLTELSRVQKMAAWREVARRIAHEIKNPLTPIQLSAQRLMRRINKNETKTDDMQIIIKECADTILEEVQTLKTLVDEFSLFARMPEIKTVVYQVNNVVENAVISYPDLYNDLSINLNLGDLPPVLLDPEQMKRALRNIIDNSIEAIPKDEKKKIEITTRENSNEFLEITISDNGPGIKEEDQDKIFTPYFSNKKKGTGLGLTIVKKIVDEHGGLISIRSNKPKGTTFTIKLPIGE